MIHRSRRWLTVEELKELVSMQRRLVGDGWNLPDDRMFQTEASQLTFYIDYVLGAIGIRANMCNPATPGYELI
jgi:hypothetical protein